MAGLDVGYRLLNQLELDQAREEARINTARAAEAARKAGLKVNPRIAEAGLR